MQEPVLIAGGGIGGLAAALALAERGIATRVFEQRSNPREEGAGIQLGPNGTRILRRLGVARLLEPAVARPEALRIMQAKSGREITRLPLGRWIEARHGAPYWTAHRHDLHAALRDRAEKSALIDIQHGKAIVSAEQNEASVTAQLDDGSRWEAPALVGADGIWSKLRSTIMGAEPPIFTGKIALRAIIPASEAGSIDLACVHIWLAPGAHIVHYPVRGGAELALVVILDGEDETEDWGAAVSPEDLARKTARLSFSAPLQALLATPSTWRLWSLHGLRTPVPFAKGRIALLGDSAHPVLPFLAQGAVLALEDAETLAHCFAQSLTPDWAFAAYAKKRAPRAARVMRASALNGRIYHLEGPAAFARNVTLRHLPAPRIIAGLDWLYGFKANE